MSCYRGWVYHVCSQSVWQPDEAQYGGLVAHLLAQVLQSLGHKGGRLVRVDEANLVHVIHGGPGLHLGPLLLRDIEVDAHAGERGQNVRK